MRCSYKMKNFKPTQEKNIFKFLDWLPCKNTVDTTIGPVVYQSEKFARTVGLKNLYIAFNGYWPDRGAGNMTGTFKDFEALPTILSFLEKGEKRIILSSAGNTGRAFAYAASLIDFDTYIVVPGRMLERMWLPVKNNRGRIHIIALKDSCDYYRAIKLSERISREYDIASEGGARNIARRDGLGTVMLEAARIIGKLPDHYFQAVGSGTGAIAVYEASLRLQQDKKFHGQTLPRLNLAQNAPFTPIYKAWEENIPIEPDKNVGKQLEQIGKMYASVLANRNPPFHITGGVYDALKQTNGIVFQITNQESIEASYQFEIQEGIDITPAASICVAALMKAVKNGWVGTEETILINITGGGLKMLNRDYQCYSLEAEAVVENENDFDWNKIL